MLAPLVGDDDAVNPARAGMILLLRQEQEKSAGKPRASGDDPVIWSPAPFDPR